MTVEEVDNGQHTATTWVSATQSDWHGMAKRCLRPVDVQIASDDRFPEPVELAAYFLVSEA
jgi:hypothetical protein